MIRKPSTLDKGQERTKGVPIKKTTPTNARKPPRKIQTWTPYEDLVLRMTVCASKSNGKRDTIDWLETKKALSWRTPDEIRGRWRRLCLTGAAIIDEENQRPDAPTPNVTVRLKGAGATAGAVVEAVEVAVDSPAPPKDENAFPVLHPYVWWSTPPLRKIDIHPIVPMATPWIEDIDLDDPIFESAP